MSKKEKKAKKKEKKMEKEKDIFGIRRKIYYILMIFTLCSCQFFLAFIEHSFAAIFPSVKEEFDWKDSNDKYFLALGVNLPLLGFVMSSYIFHALFGNWKPYELIFKLKLLIVGCLSGCMIPSSTAILICRFAFGLLIGIMVPCCVQVLEDLTHPKHQTFNRNTTNVMYSLGMITTYYLSSIISESIITWRMMYLMFLGISLFDFIVFMCIVSVNISPLYALKKKGKDAAKKIAAYYLYPVATKELIELAEKKLERIRK